MAERILTDHAERIATADPKQAARAMREAVRDSADVISFVHALRPDTLVPLKDLDRLFAGALPARQARWAVQTLVHYVLDFGVDAIVAGLAAPGAPSLARPTEEPTPAL